MSHTSFPACRHLYDALFERYGIARMKSVTSFVETLSPTTAGPCRTAALFP
jgi:hypothetical protein